MKSLKNTLNESFNVNEDKVPKNLKVVKKIWLDDNTRGWSGNQPKKDNGFVTAGTILTYSHMYKDGINYTASDKDSEPELTQADINRLVKSGHIEILNESNRKSKPEFNIDGNKSTGNAELDAHISKNFKGYDVWPASANFEIVVGYLCKQFDSTWQDVYTYYYNNNYPGEFSIKKVKI
jgi:hypothetical protein